MPFEGQISATSRRLKVERDSSKYSLDKSGVKEREEGGKKVQERQRQTMSEEKGKKKDGESSDVL